MLKPRPRRGGPGFVPCQWGLPGPTRGRRGRDAAVFKLASKTKPPSQGPGTPAAARMEGPASRGGARAHRLHVSPSCAPLRTALGVGTDPW